MLPFEKELLVSPDHRYSLCRTKPVFLSFLILSLSFLGCYLDLKNVGFIKIYVLSMFINRTLQNIYFKLEQILQTANLKTLKT